MKSCKNYDPQRISAGIIDEQANYLWNFHALDERRKKDHTILLYSLPGFYAEIWYRQSDNSIVAIKAFTGGQPLVPYILGNADN